MGLARLCCLQLNLTGPSLLGPLIWEKYNFKESNKKDTKKTKKKLHCQKSQMTGDACTVFFFQNSVPLSSCTIGFPRKISSHQWRFTNFFLSGPLSSCCFFIFLCCLSVKPKQQIRSGNRNSSGKKDEFREFPPSGGQELWCSSIVCLFSI